MKIQLLHNSIRFLTAKGQTPYYSPKELDDLIYQESWDLFDKHIEVYAVNKVVSESLRPFEKPLKVPNLNGFEKPTDFAYPITILADGKQADILEKYQWHTRASHPIRKPDADYPIASISADTIEVLPADTESLTGFYFKKPGKPVYGYDIQGSRYVFNPDKSTEIEWPENVCWDIAERVLFKLGINMRASDIAQYAQAEKQDQ